MVMFGLRTARCSCWPVRSAYCGCTANVSAPTCDWMVSFTAALSPWTSDTTAMIDVTATMLPSTVRSERSLFVQIA